MTRQPYLIALHLIIGGFILSACDQAPQEVGVDPVELVRPAKIVPVLSAGINTLRIYPGTLEASQKSELAFRVSGQLVELPAKAGMRVHKGDVLARLDEADYRNSLNEKQARHGLARIQHDQASKLLKQKLSSQLQFDQAQAELKAAGAALEQAQDNLAYTRLLAPFDGVVARVDVENFQAIQANTPLIQLQAGNTLDVNFSVPESLITQLKAADDSNEMDSYCAVVRFSSRPKKSYRACHKSHEAMPDPLTRNYTAVFTLEPILDFAVLPGMTVSVEVDFSVFWAHSDIQGLLVPVEAVFENNGKQWVWRVDEQQRARQTQVELGQIEADMLEITQGLSVDDQVIAAGVSYIREAMQVKPLVKERGL